jgi:hypothetical protein
LLPVFLRRKTIAALLLCLIAPIIALYNLFMSTRENNLYRLRMNGQVCYLRKVLNDSFPQVGNLIWLEDGKIFGFWRFAYERDYTDKYLLIDENTLFYDKGAIEESQASGFTVIVPKSLLNINNDAKIRSIINAYKLLSKSYIVQYE